MDQKNINKTITEFNADDYEGLVDFILERYCEENYTLSELKKIELRKNFNAIHGIVAQAILASKTGGSFSLDKKKVIKYYGKCD